MVLAYKALAMILEFGWVFGDWEHVVFIGCLMDWKQISLLWWR